MHTCTHLTHVHTPARSRSQFTHTYSLLTLASYTRSHPQNTDTGAHSHPGKHSPVCVCGRHLMSHTFRGVGRRSRGSPATPELPWAPPAPRGQQRSRVAGGAGDQVTKPHSLGAGALGQQPAGGGAATWPEVLPAPAQSACLWKKPAWVAQDGRACVPRPGILTGRQKYF